jgi:hypothetical protein
MGQKDDIKKREKRMADAIEAYREHGTVSNACRVSGIARSTWYRWINESVEFAEQVKDAEMDAAEALEEEARRRAAEGIDEPVYYQGRVVGYIKRYSDNLLMFLLKGAMPDKYKERTAQEVSGPGGGPIQTQMDLSRLSNKELMQLETILTHATDVTAGEGGEGKT